MLISKLHISYDRAVARNTTKDIGSSAYRGWKTPDEKIIRGLGSHFRNEAERDLVMERDKEASRIRNEFRSRFLCTPLDGVYVMPRPGAGKNFIKDLNVRPDVCVTVTEFVLETPGALDSKEINEWADRIRKQLSQISLGRSKEADSEGLSALEALATCPVLRESTELRIKELVASVRQQSLSRIELKRSLETLNIEIAGEALSPRKTPALVEAH